MCVPLTRKGRDDVAVSTSSVPDNVRGPISVLHRAWRRTVKPFAPSDCRHMVSGSVSLPSRGSFHLSLTVLFAIGHWVVFRLGGWAPLLQTGFHVSGPTLDPALCFMFSPTGVLPSALRLSIRLPLTYPHPLAVLNPRCKHLVWPLSRSLAATRKIAVAFSSYGYLDVSVPRVTLSVPA